MQLCRSASACRTASESTSRQDFLAGPDSLFCISRTLESCVAEGRARLPKFIPVDVVLVCSQQNGQVVAPTNTCIALSNSTSKLGAVKAFLAATH